MFASWTRPGACGQELDATMELAAGAGCRQARLAPASQHEQGSGTTPSSCAAVGRILRIFMSISRARETCSQPIGAGHAGQFQVGPSVGTSAGDQVWAARYILERITKIAGVVVTFDLKPIPGDWNGDGAHTNYSTESTRKDVVVIMAAIEKLKLRHKEHIAA